MQTTQDRGDKTESRFILVISCSRTVFKEPTCSACCCANHASGASSSRLDTGSVPVEAGLLLPGLTGQLPTGLNPCAGRYKDDK